MLLALHIAIAFTSLAAGLYLVAKPAKSTLNLHYTGMGLTTASGVALVVAGYGVLHVCVVGAIYLVAASVLAMFARRKLAAI
ncbi:hypothetical protein H6796_02145 [Candidatus Nomurabacteria bacterium]|nr:hypothetical protein [Candidatus Nomurabacteria bacterium]